jgi:hypothetical protein
MFFDTRSIFSDIGIFSKNRQTTYHLAKQFSRNIPTYIGILRWVEIELIVIHSALHSGVEDTFVHCTDLTGIGLALSQPKPFSQSALLVPRSLWSPWLFGLLAVRQSYPWLFGLRKVHVVLHYSFREIELSQHNDHDETGFELSTRWDEFADPDSQVIKGQNTSPAKSCKVFLINEAGVVRRRLLYCIQNSVVLDIIFNTLLDLRSLNHTIFG